MLGDFYCSNLFSFCLIDREVCLINRKVCLMIMEDALILGLLRVNLATAKSREISLKLRGFPLNFPQSPAFFPNFP